MARKYIDELGDGTINPETSGVDSQATDNGEHVKTLAPIYYTPATIANDGKATRETPVTIKSALEGKSNKNDGVYYVVGTYDYSAYSSTATYTATTSSGPFTSANSCVYSGKAYFCKTTISTPEAWNSGHWTAIPTPVLTGTIDGVTELYAGLKIAYKFSITGGSSSTYLNINNLGNKYIRRNDSNLTTHIPVNSAAFLVFDGTYWRWADYDSDNVYSVHAACGTTASTAAKAATAYGYVLTAGETFLIRFSNANTYAGKLTLNINSQGAKDIWINGAVSSASNYNIPAGIWWCHYDGTVYHIWTDGSVMFKELRLSTKLADDYISSAATWNAKQDALATQTAYSAKGSATKVPQITTNSLGQVTSISEVTISGVTPASHASTATTYGIGTTSTYGHVKLATGDMNGATNTDGVAVSKNHTHSQYAPKASPALTGTPTAPTAADGTNTTQIATTAFVQSAVAQGLSVSDAMVYKGTITLGATSPGGLTVAADKGHTYKVVANGTTKEGYVDGVKVEAGDMVICNTDSTAAATSSNYSTIAAKWDFVQGNTDGVVVGPASATSGNVVLFDGATGKLVKDGGKLGTAAFKDVASSGNASTTQVVMGNDSRLTDSRTPTSHTHGNIQNGGTLQTSDVTIANGDKLVITDSSDSNKVARASVAFDGSTVSTMLTKKGTFETVKEGNLEWGGRVWTGSYGPLDAALIDVLGANRFAFGNGDGVTVEYTRDGGTTWSDYGLTKAQKSSIFTLGQSFIIGKADSTNKATADANWSNYKVRVTMQTGTFRVYTNLQKLAIYCSTNGSQGTRVVITARTRTNEQSDGAWTNIITASLSGWSGWNIIPVSLTTWGNAGSQHSQIRFLFEATQASSEANKQYTGFSISRIYGYGGVGWTVPSTMAASGHMYTYDIDKNVTFPAKVTATEFAGPLTGNATSATKLATARKLAVSLSNTSTDTTFDGSADVTNIKVSGQLADANIASAATWNAKQDALAAQTAYTAKGSSTKVPQITTNSLGQVTNISEIDIGYINSTDLVVGNENNSTPFLLYEISNVGLTQSYTTAVTELMVYLVRSTAATVDSATANHMSFKVSIHWQWTLAKVNVEGSMPFGTITAVIVNSATPAAGTDVSTLKIYLTPRNYVSYRVVVTDSRIRGNGDLMCGTITKKGIREAIPTASDLVIIGTTSVLTMQTKENLVTSWNSTTSNTMYPSEKLVKDSLTTLDNSVVHKSGDEVISDAKTFDGSLNFRGAWDANAYQKGFGVFMLGTNATGGNYADWTEAQKDGNHHREWTLAFPSVSNINDAPFQIRITLYGGYNGRNTCNVMSKRINAYLKIASPYKVVQQYGFYDQLGGSIEDEFRISEIMWDATNTRYCIKVRNVMPEKNNIIVFVVVEYLTGIGGVRNWLKELSWASTTPEIVEGGQYFSRRTGNVTDAETTSNGRFINWADKPVLQGTYGDEIQYNWVGTSGTGGSDAGKTVTIPGFQMRAGSRAIVYFTYANTANNPTLNISSTGAKNIFANGSRITTGVNKSILSGAVLVVYDGTQYHVIGSSALAGSSSAGLVTLDNSTPLTIGTASTDGVATGKAHVHDGIESVAREDVTTPDISHTYPHTRARMTLSQITSSSGETHDPGDGYVLNFIWDNQAKFDTQIYIPNDNVLDTKDFGRIKIRYLNNENSWGDWGYLPGASVGTLLTSSDNLNNIAGKNPGEIITYRWNSASCPTNAPFTSKGAVMVSYTNSTNGGVVYQVQVVYYGSVGMYQRTQNGSSGWSDWSKILVASDITSSTNNGKLKVNETDVTVYTHPAGSAASKTGVPTANATLTFGGTFKVNQITTDATSHVSAVTERTLTLPSLPVDSVPIINVDGQTTSITTIVYSIAIGGRHHARVICPSNGGSTNITGTPTLPSGGLSFVMDVIGVRYISSNDFRYQLIFYKANEQYPYIAQCYKQQTDAAPNTVTADSWTSLAKTTATHGLLQDTQFTYEMPNNTSSPKNDSWYYNIGLPSYYNGATNWGAKGNYWLRSLRSVQNGPSWWAGSHSSGIAFGGGDTKGVISLRYSTSSDENKYGKVSFAAGETPAATESNPHPEETTTPRWWFHIQGKHNTTYTLPPLDTTETSKYAISITGSAASATTANAFNPNFTGTNSIYSALSNKASSTHTHGLQHTNFTKMVPSYDTNNPDDTWATNIGLTNNPSSENKYWLVSLRTRDKAPPWLAPNYGSGIAFGGEDTKGVVSMRYDQPSITFAGGNGSAPDWWITVKGTSGTTYTLPPLVSGFTNKYAINISGTAAAADTAAEAGYAIALKVTGAIGSSIKPVYIGANGIPQEIPNDSTYSNYLTLNVLNARTASEAVYATAMKVSAAIGSTKTPIYIDANGVPQALPAVGGDYFDFKSRAAVSATTAYNVDLTGSRTASTTNGDTIKVQAGTGTAAEITIVNAKHAASADSATTASAVNGITLVIGPYGSQANTIYMD